MRVCAGVGRPHFPSGPLRQVFGTGLAAELAFAVGSDGCEVGPGMQIEALMLTESYRTPLVTGGLGRNEAALQ